MQSKKSQEPTVFELIAVAFVEDQAPAWNEVILPNGIARSSVLARRGHYSLESIECYQSKGKTGFGLSLKYQEQSILEIRSPGVLETGAISVSWTISATRMHATSFLSEVAQVCNCAFLSTECIPYSERTDIWSPFMENCLNVIVDRFQRL